MKSKKFYFFILIILTSTFIFKHAFADRALLTAVTYNQIAKAKKLISQGAYINTSNYNRDSLLMIAIKKRFYAMATLLLDSGASVRNENKQGESAIHLMLNVWGHAGYLFLNKLINKGASLSTKNAKGNTLMHLAAKYNKLVLMRKILIHNPNLNIQNNDSETPLLVAVKKYRYYIILELLKKRQNLDIQDDKRNTVTHYAAGFRSAAVLNKILTKRPNLEIKNEKGETPLLTAVRTAKYYNVNSLLKAGASYKIKDSNGKTPLLLAAKAKSLPIVQLFIKKGADKNIKDEQNHTLLHFMAGIHGRASLNIMKTLIKSGSDVNAKSTTERTPAGIAIENKNFYAFKLLLDNGLDVHTKEFGTTPLVIFAYEKYQPYIYNLLLKRKDITATARSTKGDTLLHFAAARNDHRFMHRLFKAGAKINVRGTDGKTPLMLAVEKKKYYASKLLVDKNSDYTIKDKTGKNIFHYIANQWATYTIAIMIKKNKNNEKLEGINERDNDRNTPLAIAVSGNKDKVANELLKGGADPNMKDGKGKNILQIALDKNNYKLVRVLTDKGVRVNRKMSNEKYPIIMAIEKKNRYIAKLILDKKADANVKSPDGDPALAIALRNNSTIIVKYLLDAKADPNGTNRNGIKHLFTAYKKYNKFTFGYLMKAKANADIFDKNKRPLLVKASQDNRYAFVKHMIDNGANIDIRDRNGNTPLIGAVTSNRYYIAKLLLSKKITKTVTKKTPLDTNDPGSNNRGSGKKYKIETKKIKVLALDINAVNKRKESALYKAAKVKSLAMVELLLRAGADPNTRNKYGETPLIRAAAVRNKLKTVQSKNIIKLLLRYKANINAQNRFSKNAIDKAIAKNNHAMVLFLLTKGADVNKQDRNGNTFLKKTILNYIYTNKISSDPRKYIYTFIKYGTNVNAQDRRGRTALMDALKAGATKKYSFDKIIEVCRILLDAGATVHFEDKDDNTALDYAKKSDNRKIINMIRKFSKRKDRDLIGRTTWKDKQLGTTSDDIGLTVSSDKYGNHYLYAKYGTGYKVFKFNRRGSKVWSKKFSGSRGAVCDIDGNLYVLGVKPEKLDGKWLDKSCKENENLVPYVQKIDNNGKDLWTSYYGRRYSCAKTDARSILLAKDKGVIINTSYFNKYEYLKLVLKDGKSHPRKFMSNKPTIAKINGEGNAIYTGKPSYLFNSNGAVDWRLYRFKMPRGGKDLTIGKSKDLYVAGINKNKPSRGIFLSQYGRWNRFKWTRMMASSGKDYVKMIIVDKDENIYILGETDGSMHGQKKFGRLDIFVIKMDKKGNRIWTVQYGTKNDDSATHISVTPTNDLIVTGSTYGDLDGSNKGEKDIVIFKIDQ